MAKELWRSDKRYYLNSDRSRIVEESDSDAAFLYVTPGRSVPMDEAIRYGLAGKQDAKTSKVQKDVEDDKGKKAAEPKEDKAVKPAEDKSADDSVHDDDKVTKINGIGPGLAKQLESVGIKSVGDFRKAADRDILDLGGISPAKLREFRDQIGG